MTRTLSEHESKRLLAGYGVPFAPERLVVSSVDAVAAAHELAMPVAVKLTGEHVAHKTERGLVKLGLGSAAEVGLAAGEGPAASTRGSDDGCGRAGAASA